MKAVLISIQPKWCELIASGKKTVEVRKTKPKLETPFKVYIYETQGRTETPFVDENGHHIFKGRGQVIGEFVCDFIAQYDWLELDDDCELYEDVQMACLSSKEILDYLGEGKYLYFWHISDLVIYDKPKELSEFNHCGVNYHFNPPITRPPQSWCYCEELR